MITVHIPSVHRCMDTSEAAVALSLHAGVIGGLLEKNGIRASGAKPYRSYPIYGISVQVDVPDQVTLRRAEGLIRDAGYVLVADA